MDYQRNLLETIRLIIVGESRLGRRSQHEILHELELACIRAREQGDFDFFLEVRAIIAMPSKGWFVWFMSSGFRAQAHNVVRRHGLSVFMVALVQLKAMLAARQSASLTIAENPPAADEVSG